MRPVWAFAAIAFLGAVPLYAHTTQDTASNTSEQPLSEEEIRAVFEAAEAEPLSGEFLAQMPAELRAQFDQAFVQMAAPGERVSEWPNVGVDLESIVAAREGGAGSNMTDAVGAAGILRTYFVDRPFEAVVPFGWALIGEYGERFEGSNINVEAAHMSPKVIVVMRVKYSLRGKMRCHERSETRIYANPDVQATEADAMAFIGALGLATRIDHMGLCYGAEEREPGVYVTRYYNREGHRLPEMEAMQQPFRILPAQPFSGSFIQP